MKNIFTQCKRQYVLIVFLMLSMSAVHAQFDYVNFTNGSDIAMNNGCIDPADNVYTYGYNVGFTRVIRQFDPAGILQYTKDVTSIIDYVGNGQKSTGGIEYGNGNVYVVGKKSNDGVIIESDVLPGPSPTTWETLSSSDYNEILDVKIQGNYMYVIGNYGGGNPSPSLSFYGGTTITGTYNSTFIAKYQIAPKALVWAKTINGSSGGTVRGINLDVDNSDNVFISGDFKGSAVFFNGGTPYIFNSIGTTYVDTFLAKFDSNGEFDSSFGLKMESPNGNKRSYDVEVGNLNNAVYWSESNFVHAYDKNGSGSFLWTHTFPNVSWAFSLETNECGDVYATGQADLPVMMRAPCGGDFFGISLDATSGNTVWPSNSTSCSSYGAEVLIDSNNKEIFVGSYYSSGGSQSLIIDGTFVSGNSKGYFIGRYDDSTQNSCCNTEIDLGEDVTVCAGGSFPTLDITSQVSGSPTITWYLDGIVVQNGGTVLTTTALGTYSVSVMYSQNCIATGSMEVNDDGCCDLDVNIGSNIQICDGDPWPVLDITGQIPGYTSIIWTLNGGAFPQPFNSETVTTVGPGTYTVVVQYGDGCTTSDSMQLTVVSCEPDCEIEPLIKNKIKNCIVSFSSSLSVASGGTTIVGVLWDFGDGTTSTDPNVTHAYDSPGTYIVTLTIYGIDAHGNCCTVSIQKQVTVFHPCPEECYIKPLIQIEYVGNNVALFSSNSFSNAFTTIVGWQWSVNGTVVSNNEYFAIPWSGGTVCLTVFGITDDGRCCMERVCQSFHSPQNQTGSKFNFQVYPNPTKTQVTLDFKEFNPSEEINVIIYDTSGRVIFSELTTEEKLDVSTREWNTGVYLCKAESNGITSVKKIIKE